MKDIKMLFVCRANVGRSQIASRVFNHRVVRDSKMHDYYSESAGTDIASYDSEKFHPGYDVAPRIFTVLDEIGCPLKTDYRQQLSPDMLEENDKVVLIVDRQYWPEYLCNEYNSNPEKFEVWDIEDGKGKSDDFVRNMRDNLVTRVDDLIQRIKAE